MKGIKTMKEELQKFRRGEVILLKSGNYALILDVDPVSKIKPTAKDRYVEAMTGHTHIKNEEMKNDRLFVIESDTFGAVITIDTTRRQRCTMADLMRYEAASLGCLTDDKMNKFNRFVNM